MTDNDNDLHNEAVSQAIDDLQLQLRIAAVLESDVAVEIANLPADTIGDRARDLSLELQATVARAQTSVPDEMRGHAKLLEMSSDIDRDALDLCALKLEAHAACVRNASRAIGLLHKMNERGLL